MGTKPGRVQIEETGLPLVEVPVSASVWAASNPDEEPGPLAEIRRQLSDRFDLVIPMGRPSTPEEVVDILTTDDESAKSDDRGLSTEERSQLEQLKNNIEDIALQCDIKMPEYLTNFLANLYINYNIESLRALEAIRQAAILHCSLRKRNQLMISDIITVLPLALYHRVNPATLTDIMNTVNNNRMVDDKKNGSGLKIPRFFQQKQTKQQEFVESAPPEKARSLRDLPEGGFIKKETEH